MKRYDLTSLEAGIGDTISIQSHELTPISNVSSFSHYQPKVGSSVSRSQARWENSNAFSKTGISAAIGANYNKAPNTAGK